MGHPSWKLKSLNDGLYKVFIRCFLKKWWSQEDLTRKEDVIARYGGEEFVALVHYQDEIEVSRYIKRVKNTIRDTDFIYSNNKIKITFSAGISFRNKYESFFEAKKHADDLLYKAKNQGRDIIFLDNSQEL